MTNQNQQTQMTNQGQQPNPLQILNSKFGNRPEYGQVMQMVQGKSPQELAQIARNLANSYGIPIQQLQAMARQFGLSI